MIRARTVMCLALLASTAACGGGGGGGGSPAPATGAGGATTQDGGSATGFSNPSVIASSTANSVGTPTMATDATSQTATLIKTDDNPDVIAIHVPSVGMDHSFTLTGVGLENVDFNGVPIYNIGDPNNADNILTNFNMRTDVNADGSTDKIIYDVSGLTASNYGLWEHVDASGNMTVGAYSTGTLTLAADMPKKGKATYAGSAIGTGSDLAAKFNVVGAWNGSADFDKQHVDWNTNLTRIDANGATSQFGTLTGSAGIFGNKFAGSVTSSGTATALSGTTSGAFYGTGASEIGGVFSASGGGTNVIGAFGGKKQ